MPAQCNPGRRRSARVKWIRGLTRGLPWRCRCRQRGDRPASNDAVRDRPGRHSAVDAVLNRMPAGMAPLARHSRPWCPMTSVPRHRHAQGHDDNSRQTVEIGTVPIDCCPRQLMEAARRVDTARARCRPCAGVPREGEILWRGKSALARPERFEVVVSLARMTSRQDGSSPPDRKRRAEW